MNDRTVCLEPSNSGDCAFNQESGRSTQFRGSNSHHRQFAWAGGDGRGTGSFGALEIGRSEVGARWSALPVVVLACRARFAGGHHFLRHQRVCHCQQSCGAWITPRFFGNFILRRSIRLDPPYWISIALMSVVQVGLAVLGAGWVVSNAKVPSAAQIGAHFSTRGGR